MLSHPTIQDVAKTAQVEVNDVMKVILQQTGVDRIVRARVLVTMQQMNFPAIPETTKATQTHRTLGVIAPHSISGEYMSAVLDSITNITRPAKIGLKVNVQGDNPADELVTFLSDPQIFGVLLVSPNNYRETLDICRQYQKPVATFSFEDDADVTDTLVLEIDNERSIMNAVDYLVSLKHRRLGFITGNLAHNDAIERFDGFKRGISKHSISYDESLIRYGDFMQESGYRAGISLLQQERPPTAIIASNDMMAIGALYAAQDMGLQVGRQLSIIGFDDIALGTQIKPSLTTMAQPYMTMVMAAIEGLQKMANGEILPDYKPRFATEFIIRGSTGAPR